MREPLGATFKPLVSVTTDDKSNATVTVGSTGDKIRFIIETPDNGLGTQVADLKPSLARMIMSALQQLLRK